jgi:beta-glucosidase
MKNARILYVFSTMLLLFTFACSPQEESNKAEEDIEKKIDQLLSQMTLEEKAGQMTQMGIPAICEQDGYWDDADSLIIDTAKLRKALSEDHIGSFLGKGFYPPTKEEYYKLISQIQDFAVNKTRLGIPIIYATDAVHGAHYTAGSTVFPHQIALAATGDPALAEKMAEITAYELRASNTPLNFAPVVDISWQAQWGRVFETFGEDPYITAQMGSAFVRGSQGNDLSDSVKVAACLKHLIGYGSPQYGKDRKNAIIPERYIRQYYLPPFAKAVEDDVAVVMINSGLVNGVPGHTNKFLITDLLKGELGFQGVTVSDWGDMQFLSDFHKTAPTHKDAVRQMVNAGLDMCMVPYDASFAHYVVDLVREGEISESRIDDAVRRILRLKFRLGLFENPNTHYAGYTDFGSEKFAEASYKTASEAITLLKNNDVLPLSKNKKVLITGVAAHSLNYLNGPWTRSWSGQEEKYNDPGKLTILDALRNKIGTENTEYVVGTDFDSDINTQKAVQAAKNADYIVACLGEIPNAERPSDIKELYLPEAQRNLVKQLSKTGKPVILVLVEGRGRIINDITDKSAGILLAYYPGNEGGRALVDVLYGDVNPSGKLPYSYQKHAATPMPYIHTVSDRADNHGGFTDYDPQWPFGFGLSYTTFQYDSIYTDKTEMKASDSLKVSIQVTNTGERSGKEIVQLYVRDEFATVDPDFERLVRFEKIHLEAGETQTVTFNLSKDDLAFVDTNQKWITESGTFILMVGNRMDIVKRTEFNFINEE